MTLIIHWEMENEETKDKMERARLERKRRLDKLEEHLGKSGEQNNKK